MFTFKVQPDDGEAFEVTAGSRDLRVWEKTGPNRSIGKLMAELKMTSLYEVAHIAARRQQLFTGSLQEFGETCELVVSGGMEFEEYVDREPDPTRTGP